LAGRKGFTQDQALAQQRLGECYMAMGGARSDAVYHIGEALKLYDLWGSHAVVNHLRKKYESLLAPVSSIDMVPSYERGNSFA